MYAPTYMMRNRIKEKRYTYSRFFLYILDIFVHIFNILWTCALNNMASKAESPQNSVATPLSPWLDETASEHEKSYSSTGLFFVEWDFKWC